MAQATAGHASHGTAYFALQQTAGKGQRGKIWHTTPGENIMMSVVIQPEPLKTSQQFLLSAAIALGCYDFFKNYAGEETSIKWPNDIYWRDRKAAGILIESRVGRATQTPAETNADAISGQLAQELTGNDTPDRNIAASTMPDQPTGSDIPPPTTDAPLWLFAIAGMGININQTDFSQGATRPVSLKQITGKTFDIQALARELCQALETRYRQLGTPHSLLADYRQALYKLDQTVKLKKDNYVFETTITGVTRTGQLTTRDVLDRQFEVGEIEWIL